MLRKATDVTALTITVDEDGVASLSGINHADLRELLDIAAAYRQDHPPPIVAPDTAAIHQTNLDAFAGHLFNQHILEVLSIKLSRALNPDLISGSITKVRALHSYRLARLEESVIAAEALAAAAPADSLKESIEILTRALHEATQALAVLKQIQ